MADAASAAAAPSAAAAVTPPPQAAAAPAAPAAAAAAAAAAASAAAAAAPAAVTLIERSDLRCALCNEGHSPDTPLPGPLVGVHPFVFGRERLWAHDDCAIWSPQAFRAAPAGAAGLGLGAGESGELWWNLAVEVRRGRKLRCALCGTMGATIGCQLQVCRHSFHLPCARTTGWDGDDTAVGAFYCPRHRRGGGGSIAAIRAQQVSACFWSAAAGVRCAQHVYIYVRVLARGCFVLC
ncbi:hypothetical protein JKP88DRAFT_179550 [Tribonema minus]|uniref:PHD-type domain-containing protein n=1 Tax=Tribonema minus TaxID=303371 RepID=A0A835Z817_9STRA|nr:hypothetical protein JKP88DRAFT_179550 [Tribonema minus]